MLLNIAKAFILEILTTQPHTSLPEMTEKPEIFEFFQIFDLKKRKFSIFFGIILTNFLLRVLCHLDYSNRFSNLEDTKKYQKNTLTSPTALILKIFRKN